MKSIDKLMDISIFLNDEFIENELQEIKGGTSDSTNKVNNGSGCECTINNGTGCDCSISQN